MPKFCTECGTPHREGAKFCPACGERYEPTQEKSQEQSPNPNHVATQEKETSPQGDIVSTVNQGNRKKRKLPALIAAVAIICVAVGVAVFLMMRGTIGDIAVGNNYTETGDIAAGNNHTVRLRENGTVVAIGGNSQGQLDVGEWRNIVSISAGAFHTVGLRSDGTVVAVGSNSHGQLDVDRWTNITAISAGASHTVGLRSDGTVVAVGGNTSEQIDVGGWRNIVSISAGGLHTVGLRSDGTVVSVGNNSHGPFDDRMGN